MRRIVLALAAAAGFAVGVVPALGVDKSVKANADDTFTPKTTTLSVGDSVTVSNSGGGFHNVHWDDKANAEQDVGPTWTTSRSFAAAGTYRFYCEAHGDAGGVGMSAVVVVEKPATTATTTTAPTTTQTTPPPTTTTGTTEPTPTEPSGGGSPTAPTRTAPSSDASAPRLSARMTKRIRRLQLAITLSERSRVVAVVRRGRASFTVRFVLGPGTTRRFLLRPAEPGRYRITLTATDEAGNRARAVNVTVRVRR